MTNMLSPTYLLPFLLLAATAASAENDTEKYRLPKNIIPSHYSLDLVIDPDNSTFSGFVEITLTATNATNGTIKLHASPNHLTLKGYALLDYSLECNATSVDKDAEIVTFTCPQGSLDGQHKLLVEFNGTLAEGDTTNGIYKSSYLENEEQQVVVATRFLPIYARRAFPCFDEPSLKATFDIFITRPASYGALSNMPQEESFQISADQLQSKFVTTPKMSTYLVAFVVSKFDASVKVRRGNETYSIYTRSSVKDRLEVATTYATSLIDTLVEMTGISYDSLGDEQLVQVVLPNTLGGTVENLGLVTYSEEDLLNEQYIIGHKEKQRIVMNMANQLAQQWFGDYVSPRWWSDTWLQEGFGTFFQYYIPDLIADEDFELEQQFVLDVLQSELEKDGVFSRPLYDDEDDINTLTDEKNEFNDISYYKGACIVRMIKGMAGEDYFKEALQKYLKKYHYNTTSTQELLQIITETAVDVYTTDFAIRTWLEQPGYPLLTANYTHQYNTSFIQISQEPFGGNSSNSTGDSKWYIPVSYTTADERDFSIAMKNLLVPGYKNRIYGVKNTSWIIFNMQRHGYYRVNYDDGLWDLIIKAMNNEEERNTIHALNRAQLIDDIFVLARMARVSFQRAFDLAEYLRNETDYYPWATAVKTLKSLADRLTDDETHYLLLNTTARWWKSAMSIERAAPSKHIDYIKEAFILEWSCKFEQVDCYNYAKEQFRKYKDTTMVSNNDMRATVFCYALRNSSKPLEDYEFLFSKYVASTSVDERNDLITGMGCSLDDTVISTYLNETLADDSRIRREDVIAVYRSLYSSSEIGLEAVLTFAFNTAPDMVAKYEGMRVLTSIFLGTAPILRTPKQRGLINQIVDYYSEIDDILVSDWSVYYAVQYTLLLSKTYGDTIKTILQEKIPTQGANHLQPTYFVSGVLTLIVAYFTSC
ncbi:hypothetical protein NQ318_013860 [Aromia moschata]|uniref:Aminopeptidase n=1 Tax=Aromia moschata TaxID=1265417 RepID=A0AAV8Z8Q4_9CUCU|nr:hypothetical protein NQ318_013860 [Aromia moschata]